MALPQIWDVWTWVQVADAVGVSVSTAKRLRREYHAFHCDPLPVTKFCGRVVARRAELLEWALRNTRPIRPSRQLDDLALS